MSIKKIYSKEYLILIAIGFLPLIWKVLQISLLVSFENALKILGQISLIHIIFKIFEESILNPLYKILSKYSYQNEEDKIVVAKKFLVIYSLITVIFTIIVLLLSTQVLKISKVPDYIFRETNSFLKLYIISCSFGVVSKYLYTFSVINKDTKKLFIYLLIKAILTALLFLVIIPKFTLGLGVNGVAICEIIVNIITIIYLTITLPHSIKKKAIFDKKLYFKLFIYSFLETLIRNVVYYFVILVFLNLLDNQDLYYVSNEYIWSIMLVPCLAQSSLIRQDIANNKDYSLKPYFINSIILIGFMLFLIPLALILFKYVYTLENYFEYFIVLVKLVPCYFIFVIDSVIEAYFFATGRLHHILIQNLLTNILVYLVAFIFYLCGLWVVTLDSIILLFNLGVIVSSCYTILAYFIEKKKISKTKV